MKLSKLRDDAFLYKDLTQWIRRQTFLPFFFGMLAAGEIITLVVFSSSSQTRGGKDILSFLLWLISIYGVLITLQCFADTFRERREGLFEIHMLSGIRPAKLVQGKFLSILVQFTFGLCCLVPYMFFAVMQGNVGYFELLLRILLILFLFLSHVLVAISSGLVAGGTKSIIGRIVCFAGVLGFCWSTFSSKVIVVVGGAHSIVPLNASERIALLVMLFVVMGVLFTLLFAAVCYTVPYRKRRTRPKPFYRLESELRNLRSFALAPIPKLREKG